jgi:acetyltransferase-like isoleucine patch superfamily enzyme
MYMFTSIGENIKAHHTVCTYGRNTVGDNSIITDNVILGYPSTSLLLELRQVDLNLEHADYDGCTIGNNAILRSGTVFYCNVRVGHNVRTGHRVLVRENCTIGHNVSIGTNTVLDRDCVVGNYVSMQSGVYLPNGTQIEEYVFLGPGATLTNDRFPIRDERPVEPARIRRGASLGANCVILPGITVGEGALVGANAVVTLDVPDWHLARGVPAEFTPLPEKYRVLNKII